MLPRAFPFVRLYLTLCICISAILRALNILYDATDHPHRLSSLQFFTFSTPSSLFSEVSKLERFAPWDGGGFSAKTVFPSFFFYEFYIPLFSQINDVCFLRSFLIGGLKAQAAFLFSAAPCARTPGNQSLNQLHSNFAPFVILWTSCKPLVRF